MYVLNQESLMQMLKEEFIKFGAVVIGLFIFFKIFYFNESLIIVAKIIIAQTYLFIWPGFVIMLCFKDKISFIYRLLIGIGLGYSLNILITYYVNIIIKVNIGRFYWVIPLIMVIAGIALFLIKNKNLFWPKDNQGMSI